MGVELIKAISGIGRRGLNWDDRRARSPKALDDFSGVILGKVTAQGSIAVQELDYDVLSRIYMCNDLAWTCINLVSSTAGLGRLRVRRRGTDGDVEYLDDHPLQKALDFPNASMTQFDLIQSYVTHQMLFGTVLIVLLRQDMNKVCPVCQEDGKTDCSHQLFYDSTSPVLQFMPIHPDNYKIEYVKALQKRCFFYTPNGPTGKQYLIHPDNMLTDPMYNPDISFYGVSPTKLIERWLKLDATMTSQVDSYFSNGAIPSMIVNLKPGNNYTYDSEPSTLVEKMKEGWMNQFAKGGKTVKAPAFVFGDIAVQRVQEKVDEAVGKNLYFEIQGRVCATYGVPANLYEIGLKYGSQRASAEQSEKDFYNRTISKILHRFKSKVQNLVLPSYPDSDELELHWDLKNMGIAAFLLQDQEKRVEEHWKIGLLQRNKAQVLLGYEPDSSELGDDYYRLTVMGDGNSQAGNQLDNNLENPPVLNE
jgi:phage portal protein BeeE